MSGRGDSRPSSVKNTASRPPSIRTTGPSVEASDFTGQPGRASAMPHQQSPAQPVFRMPESPRQTGGDGQNQAAKVAIPRLKRDADTAEGLSGTLSGRHRVNHACEPCRHRKTKCSGERPVCKHCQDFKIVCFYADGKRDRVKKQFSTLTEKVADYEKLLRSLLDKVPEDEARAIKSSLDRVTQYEVDDGITDTITVPSVEAASEHNTSGGGESEVSAGVGSTGALDRTDEDFTREGAKQTGFIGKNSEITWMQRLKQENKYGEDSAPATGREGRDAAMLGQKHPPNDESVPLPEAVDGFTIHDFSYHLDDLSITTFEAVDPYEMPTAETAQLLFSTYMQRVHPSFPVVGRVNLNAQLMRHISNPVQRPPDKWLAIVNMIFAISAKYSHLMHAEWQGDERDHLIYFARAKLLGFEQDVIFTQPDLQYIQILSLMSFYLFSTGQVNRSWMLAGLAIRASCAVGLNMRNESTNLKDSLKEIRYRLWWALYTLEHRLCSITGRVNCIIDDHCTTPLPIPLEEESFDSSDAKRMLVKEMQRGERAPSANTYSPSNPASTPSEKRSSSAKSEQSRSPSALQSNQAELEWARDVSANSSLYFLHLVQLTRLTQNIFSQLYNPASIAGSWSFIQSQIKDLDVSLETWYRSLPSIFDFRRKQRDRDFYEYRLSLGFFYYGTKQMVFRPCLCRLDRKVPNQSKKSEDFNRTSAMACVEAAQDSLRLIPDEPNAGGLISVGPWWSILHWLVQAATVLMLELSFRAHHMPEDAETILESSKKAVRWLHALGEDNLSAKRAWSLCDVMLRDAAKKIGHEVKDIPDNPPGRIVDPSETSLRSNLSTANELMLPQHLGRGGNMFGSGMTGPPYQALSSFDTMMQYDQYFPGTSGTLMSGNVPAYGMPSNESGADYMPSAFSNDQHQWPDSNR